MENETQGQATPPAVEPPKKKPGIGAACIGKITTLWKSGVKGKAICIVGALVILGIIGSCGDDEDGGGGGGSDWKFADENFYSAFQGFPKDEGMVYKHDRSGLPVMQSTKKGNLVECFDKVIWVETKRRYEENEPLDMGYYVRRGSMEYETALGTEKRVPRYVEVTDKIQKQIDGKKPSIAKQVEKLQAGKAAGETTIITLPGGVTMEMVWCPPGTFTMGSLNGDDAEQPPHQVTLTKGFWMGKTEVSQAQWKSVMGHNPSSPKGDDLPVQNVSWDDCQEFCKNTGLQLPTEAQWEYACRAGSTGAYAGTEKLDEMGWYRHNSGNQEHPVGTKQPNAWGLYDMHGNVWEWCADWKGNYPTGAVVDPQGLSSGSSRVERGGCYEDPDYGCTSSFRGSGVPSRGYPHEGFRLVRTLSD